MMNRKLQTRCKGFTLLESLFAAFLIGLVIAALAASSGAFTMANAAAVDLSTAEFLIEEIRELTADLLFSDLLDLNTHSPNFPANLNPYSPPIDVNGASLGNDFAVFTQQVSVDPCGDDFNAVSNDDFVRITVAILKNNLPISEASWIRANLD